MIHRHDLEAEQHRAQKQQPVAALDAAKAVLHAQQVQPHHGNGHAHPQLCAALTAQKQAEHRHQHHIHGGQKARLCGGGVQRDAQLLRRAGQKQQRAAHKPGFQQQLALGRRFGLAVRFALPVVQGVKRLDRGQQHQHRHPAAPRQKGERAHAGTGALRHKGCAPDQGAQHQQH